MTNILKSWKTTSIAVVIIAGLGYKAFTTGFTIQDSLWGLFAIGFIFAKDNDKTHSKLNTKADGDITDPDNPKYPKTRF